MDVTDDPMLPVAGAEEELRVPERIMPAPEYALHNACEQGDTASVEQMLGVERKVRSDMQALEDADPDISLYGMGVLHHVEVNRRDHMNMTALHVALVNFKPQCAKALLEFAKTTSGLEGSTYLHVVAAMGAYAPPEGSLFTTQAYCADMTGGV
jgi:hypothetical protein